MAPNILLIVADDLNAWIGALGRHPDARTPNIDALARRGTLFTHAYCAAPYCNASRMAMFTGRLPTTTGIYHDEDLWNRPGRPATFVERLREAGYYTFGAGKVFHGVFDYTAAGRDKAPAAAWKEIEHRPFLWDDFRSPQPEPLPPGRPLNGLFDFDDFAGVPPVYHHFDWGPIPAEREAELPDIRVMRTIADFLASPPREPFFAAAGIYKPHLPWYVPARFFELYDKVTLPLVRDDDLDDVPPIGRDWALSPPDHALVTGRGQWRAAVHGYLAAVSFCDYVVGEVVAALDRCGLADRTAIVLCGDNGFHLGEKLHWRKFCLWEEATRVPLVVALPGGAGQVRRVHAPVSLIDLFPTLLDLAGVPCPDAVDGLSLCRLMADGAARSAPAIMSWGRGNHSVRNEGWRLIRYCDGTRELYDHRTDPHEWSNLAEIADFKHVLDELTAALPPDPPAPGDGEARPPARPDFLGIGAQKAGTTWLYENLKRHPAIAFPSEKEIHFWDEEYKSGGDKQSWASLFDAVPAAQKAGEITPAYAFLDPGVIREIAEFRPQLRLFISLRNPIDRAWSSALMALERAEMTIEDASPIWFMDHFQSRGSLARGNYLAVLDNWLAAFPAEQLHIIVFDDIVADPRGVLAGLSRHLGVDPAFYDTVADEEIAKPVFAGPGHPLPETLAKYLRVLYERDIERLARRLDRDLGHWLAI